MARVVIAGAGPAGAALGLLLAQRGVEVVVCERATDFAREFRGELLLPSGLIALEQMKLWSQTVAVPHVTPAAFELWVGARYARRFDLDAETFGPYLPRWMSQPALLEMLAAEAGRCPGYTLQRGTTVRGLVREGGRTVGVRVLSDAGESEIRADLVVGADGRSSAVRRRANLPERADPTPMDVVWCKLPRAPYLRGAEHVRAYIGDGHLLIAAPIYDDMMQIAWIISKGAYGEIRSRGMDWCLERMAHHVSDDLAAHLRTHAERASEPFLLSTVSDRVLEWSRPGLLVIGDAAHTMSPVGGQGLNIALRDAIVAANHLVPILAGPAEPAAVDAACRAIQAEREPEIVSVQTLQARPPRVMLRDTWWTRLLFAVVPLLLRTPLAAGAGPTLERIAYGVTEVELRV